MVKTRDHTSNLWLTLCSAIMVVSLLVLTLTSGGTAYAQETGGYPWADASEVNLGTYDWGYLSCQSAMQLAQTCSAHYGSRAGQTYRLSDPWRYDVRNCTSFAAWKVHQQFGITIANWGDAQNWDSAAKRAGYAVDSNARVGDVAVWDSGRYGHVAYVAAVNPDGSVNVEQYNKAGRGEFSRQSRVRADHYIHIASPQPVPAPAIVVQPVVSSVVQTVAEALPIAPLPQEALPVSTPSTPAARDVPTPASSDTVSYFAASSSVKKPKVYAVKHASTKSGKVEVSTADPQSENSTWSSEVVTPEIVAIPGEVSYTLGDYNADGTNDLYKIAYDKTVSGFVEVSVLDGATDYAGYLGKWTTSEPMHAPYDVWYAVADQNGDGSLDLYQIWYNHTVSECVEIKIIDGTDFSKVAVTYMIPEPQHLGMDAYYMVGDHNNDGQIDLFQVQHNATLSGFAEVKVFDGALDHAKLISKWTTAQQSYQGYGPSI